MFEVQTHLLHVVTMSSIQEKIFAATTAQEIFDLVDSGLDANASFVLIHSVTRIRGHAFPLQYSRTGEVAEALIKCGADVTVAIQERSMDVTLLDVDLPVEVVRVILEQNKLDVNARNIFSVGPLETAVRNNNIDLIRLLLEYGAEASYAIHNCGSVEAMKLLFEFGADPKTESDFYGTLREHYYKSMKRQMCRGQTIDSELRKIVDFLDN